MLPRRRSASRLCGCVRTTAMFQFAFHTVTLLIAANLADSPTEGILWALPCCERFHLLFGSQA
jgi:hypothetical protein